MPKLRELLACFPFHAISKKTTPKEPCSPTVRVNKTELTKNKKNKKKQKMKKVGSYYTNKKQTNEQN